MPARTEYNRRRACHVSSWSSLALPLSPRNGGTWGVVSLVTAMLLLATALAGKPWAAPPAASQPSTHQAVPASQPAFRPTKEGRRENTAPSTLPVSTLPAVRPFRSRPSPSTLSATMPATPHGGATTKNIPPRLVHYTYYYPNGRIEQQLSRLMPGKISHGKVTVFHPNGNKMIQGRIHYRKMVGCWIYWFPTGIKMGEENYNYQGKREGIVKHYYDNGQLSSTTIYRNGKKEGIRHSYHKNGRLSSTGMFRNGKKEGIWKYYHRNGRLSFTGSYQQGKADGVWNSFYQNGRLSSTGMYRKGKTVGIWKCYYTNGELYAEGIYQNHQRIGVWRYHYERSFRLINHGTAKK